MSQNEMPKSLKRHIVECPHCGAQALDHMTECPKCKGKLIPKGYQPLLDKQQSKTIKTVLWITLSVIALALIIWRFSA